MSEEKTAYVFQFFQKSSVAAVRITAGTLRLCDKIHILGNTTDFIQTIESMQIKDKSISEANSADEVGIRVQERVRPNDVVYKVI
jgi:putative protease